MNYSNGCYFYTVFRSWRISLMERRFYTDWDTLPISISWTVGCFKEQWKKLVMTDSTGKIFWIFPSLREVGFVGVWYFEFFGVSQADNRKIRDVLVQPTRGIIWHFRLEGEGDNHWYFQSEVSNYTPGRLGWDNTLCVMGDGWWDSVVLSPSLL